MSKIDLSIVITAHDEGILLYKTLRSVFRAVNELEDKKIKYEVIAHVDSGDKDTLSCLKKYAGKEKIIVVENNFGDISKSRNYVVSIAKGEFITFLDGDDLISRNWYYNAFKTLKDNKGNGVVFPEAVLTFQDDNNHILVIQKKDEGTKEDFLTILSANRWGSVVMAKKDVFMKTPYMVMDAGYCHEDYAFNVQTLERRIPHLIAPDTVLFYRRLEGSRLAQANSDNLVLPKMDYFDLGHVDEKFKGEKFFEENDADEEVEEEKEKTFRDNTLYKSVRGNWFLNYLITPFLRLALETKKKIKGKDESESELEEALEEETGVVPDFVIKQWRDINDIDIQLYPKKEDLEGTMLYDAIDSIDIGKAYANLSHAFSDIPDYIFLVPWVVRGGADKVMINYIKALLEIHPDWHFAVIATLAEKNTWAHQLPEVVDLYELGEVAQYLSEGGVDVLLTLLITQLGCKKLHILNSEWGYRWAKNHSTLIREQYDVNVSFFAEERIAEWDGGTRIASYENPGLFEIFPNVKNVFTDNKNIVNITVDRNDFDRNKFKVHYQPIDFEIRKRDALRKMSKKILWAGRIDTVKMPELIIEIGAKLGDDIQIDMYGAITNACYGEEMFEGAKNIKYCGEYNGFSDIPTDEYDLFLYTSKNDGMPNAILEAAAVGLPIIASNDGGVKEFIVDNKTGILIEDFQKPDEYVQKINNVYKGKYDLQKLVKSAQKTLTERHSMDVFRKMVKKDIG